MPRVLIALAAVGGCILAAQALAATGEQSAVPPTVRVTGVVDSVQAVDNPPADDSGGDILTFTQKLTNAGGKKVGTASAFCVRTAPGQMRECQGTFDLPRGQVFVSGPDPETAKRHPLAIVGGTGLYADVGGHVNLEHVTAVKDRVVFVFRR
jgi:hypothetical protein